MKRVKLHPVALVGGLVCFLVFSGLAAFWSQEIWSLWGGDEQVRRENEVDEEPTAGDDGPPATYEPTGPEPPYEESVREPEEDGEDSLAPVYRELPERCGSIRTEREGGERAFPPRETDYRVDIQGELAAVTVEQTFVNPTEATLDAVYQFPLNKRAAVHGMTMRVGDRVVRAQIQKKKEARETYEEAKQQGKNAALLSQERPNWFTQRVANIEPGQRIDVTLEYVHPLPREEGAYQFVVPTQLGERYGDGGSAANDLLAGDGDSDELPEASSRRPEVSVDVRLEAPMAVRQIRSASHRLRLRKYAADDWQVSLAGGERRADRHFRMQFELSAEEPEAGLNTYWDEEEGKGYFSLLLEPPRRPDPQKISNREVVFVMDTSGSMQGRPIARSKRFVKTALRDLRRVRDSFRIVRFDQSASGFSEEPIEATEASVDEAIEYVERMSANGGTEYEPGLERALGPERPAGAVRLVVFLTDGHIGYEFEALRELQKRLGDARLFGIGIGGSANRYLLEEMGRIGRGFARFLGEQHEERPDLSVDQQIDRIVERIESPVMTDLRVDWGGLEVSGVSPKPVPDLFAGESVRVHGTYENPGEHTVTVHGTIGADRVSIPVTREFPAGESDGKAVELTWARQKIRENMHDMLGAQRRRDGGQPPEVYRDRVVELGLEHSLVTQWTSFVAVAESGDVRGEKGKTEGIENLGTNKMLSSENIGKGALKEVFSTNKNFDSHTNVAMNGQGGGRGSGGMGLRGTGSGGGGTGFGRVHGLGKVDKGSKKSKGSSKSGESATGGRTTRPKTSVRERLAKRQSALQGCYEHHSGSETGFKHEIAIRLTVDAAGDVVDIEIEQSTVGDADLEECIVEELRETQFAELEDVGETQIVKEYAFGKDKGDGKDEG
jgi:Ca-activated chloride channel family protein